jgi:hypothetical protein
MRRRLSAVVVEIRICAPQGASGRAHVSAPHARQRDARVRQLSCLRPVRHARSRVTRPEGQVPRLLRVQRRQRLPLQRLCSGGVVPAPSAAQQLLPMALPATPRRAAGAVRSTHIVSSAGCRGRAALCRCGQRTCCGHPRAALPTSAYASPRLPTPAAPRPAPPPPRAAACAGGRAQPQVAGEERAGRTCSTSANAASSSGNDASMSVLQCVRLMTMLPRGGMARICAHPRAQSAAAAPGPKLRRCKDSERRPAAINACAGG